MHVQGGSVQAVQPVDELGAPVQLARIGLSGNALYGATTDGELVQADLRIARDQQLPMVRQPLESLERALKEPSVSKASFMMMRGNSMLRFATHVSNCTACPWGREYPTSAMEP